MRIKYLNILRKTYISNSEVIKMEHKIGTTTIGLKFINGVVLAAESKATLGNLVADKEAKKIVPLDKRIAMTTSGSVGDAQQLERILKAEINLYKVLRNADITVNAVATLLANILQSYRMFPYLTMLIIAGVDKRGPQLCSIDPLGGVSDSENYIATGSGSPIAYGVLEEEYKDDLEKSKAIEIGIKAIRAARERDAFSGGKRIDAIVIDEKGCEWIDKKIIKKLMQ